jgi:hypothetical protein
MWSEYRPGAVVATGWNYRGELLEAMSIKKTRSDDETADFRAPA